MAPTPTSKVHIRPRYGYSFGWGGDEAELGTKHSLWGTTWTGTSWWDAPPFPQPGPSTGRKLATYQFFPHPLRFTTAAWAQINWHYDTGHNVPANLCPVRCSSCFLPTAAAAVAAAAAPTHRASGVAKQCAAPRRVHG